MDQWRIPGAPGTPPVQILPFSCSFWRTFCRTRMHSNGMRTARFLTVSQHALAGGCIPACTGRGRGCLHRGWCLPGGVGCLPGEGGVCPGGGRYPPLWTDRHLGKHNLRKLRLQAVIIGCRTFFGS